MIKKIIFFFYLLSLTFSKENFTFLFEVDGEPYNGNIQCFVKKERDGDKEKVKIKKIKKPYKTDKKTQNKKYKNEYVKYKKKKYHQYLIEYDFQNFFNQTDEYEKLILEFIGNNNGTYLSGEQVIDEIFWWGDKIQDPNTRLEEDEKYFNNSKCIKDRYSGKPKGYVIEVKLRSSRLEFKLDIFDMVNMYILR